MGRLVRVLGEWLLAVVGSWRVFTPGGVFSDEVAMADLSTGVATGGATMIGAFLVATVLSVYMTSLAATHTAALRTTLFLARRNPRPTTSV
ncbi:hypothetical protein [Actinomyces provencensis]|uniref:hypothetical protein n=1 Tax=Actinomyces provencensis TaxID=1720198 RepID=UPI00117780B2|nr:hypothetical protein [Actinomyces provencensis]